MFSKICDYIQSHPREVVVLRTVLSVFFAFGFFGLSLHYWVLEQWSYFDFIFMLVFLRASGSFMAMAFD